MTLHRKLLLILGLVALGGCNTTGAASSVDAIIPNHTQESIQELTDIISKAINKPTTLTQHAFNQSSRLAIEAKNNVDISIGVIDGRQMENPPIFQLTLQDGKCTLNNLQTGQSWPLNKAECIANTNN